MTNHAAETERIHQPEAALRDYLARQGVHDISGLDLLRLVRTAGHTYDAILAEQMRDAQLSGPRWRLLLHLLLAEEHGISAVNPTQLSKYQHVSKNTISAHLRALEEQGLIERELDADDRRQFRIKLSPGGRELIERSTPAQIGFLNTLADELTQDERETLTMLLGRLLSSLRAHSAYAPEAPK